MPTPFRAYLGSEPFIFVSYAHKDRDIVYPEIKRLHDEGYRIWYDEGIPPASEWPAEIAKAIEDCMFFLVFLSPQSVTSEYVKKEIHYALGEKKPVLPIYIQQTDLPRGLKFQLGSLQAIMKFQMDNQEYYQKLVKALPQALTQHLSSVTNYEPEIPLFKILVLGDGATGRHALVARYVNQGPKTDLPTEIGVNISEKIENIEGKKVKFEIWVIGGQHRFKAARSVYYADAVGAILVFDVTRPESLSNVKLWINELHATIDDIPLIILGNKVDLRHHMESTITTEQGQEFIAQLTKGLKNTEIIEYIETSAKTLENVTAAFRKLGLSILARGVENRGKYWLY